MGRRPAKITQAEIARTIRAARKEGVTEVEVQVGDGARVTFKLKPSTGPEAALEPEGEIVL